MNLVDAFPQFPTCMLCADAGIVDHTGRFEFCLCPAGQRRALVEPNAAELANEARVKIGAAR